VQEAQPGGVSAKCKKLGHIIYLDDAVWVSEALVWVEIGRNKLFGVNCIFGRHVAE
jgi:hypothetical protein